jgi:hypothetical protein
MDAEGGVLAVQGDRTVEGFEKTLADKVQRFLDLSAKAKAGDPVAQIDLALLECDLGRSTFEEMQKRLENKQLSDAQKAMLLDVELGAMITELQKAQDEATQKAGMKRIVDAFAGGRVPNDKEKKQIFFQVVLGYAVGEEDPDLADRAFQPLKALYEEAHGKDNPQLQQWSQRVADKIAEMRDAQKEGCGSEEGTEEGCGEESGKDK